MLIAGSAIAAMLARAPGAEALLDALDASQSPHMTTPLALLAAATDLARAKAGSGDVTAPLLAGAQLAVAEFAAALALREVPVTAELGRRAGALLAEGRGSVERCVAEAAARAYRTDLLAAPPALRAARAAAATPRRAD